MSKSICPVCKETHRIQHINTEETPDNLIKYEFKCENCHSTFLDVYELVNKNTYIVEKYITVQELIETLLQIPLHDRIHMPVMIHNEETSQLSKINLVDINLGDRVDLNIKN